MSNEETKERGPKFTEPELLKLPKSDSFSSWSRSLDAQLKYQHQVKEEVTKKKNNPRYEMNVTLSKRYKYHLGN